MEWVMYTAAGLLSGAPPDEHPQRHPGRRTPHGADHRRRGTAAGPVAAGWSQAASPSTVQVWAVPHAGHPQGLATAPGAWEAHVISLLNTALNPATTPVGQCAGHNGVAVEERQLGWVGDGPADQHPVLRRAGGGPGVVAVALAAVPA